MNKVHPCLECIVFPCCMDICENMIIHKNYLKDQVKATAPQIYSKNGLIRKNIPDHIRKHYNSHVEKWNEAVIIKEKIIDRYAPPELRNEKNTISIRGSEL